MPWLSECPYLIRRDVSLAEKTTWRMGGAAATYAEPATLDALRGILRLARTHAVPVYALGGGSNLLVQEEGVAGLVICLGREEGFGRLTSHPSGEIEVGAALPLPSLVRQTTQTGWSGLEEWAGIPGTVGGAIRMNAGSAERGILSRITAVNGVALDGESWCMQADQIQAGYRSSTLPGGIITGATFRLTKDDPRAIEERRRSFAERKRDHQPIEGYSAGCVFRNPPGASAGRLIEESGCKGLAVGDAVVSKRHANFLLNRGRARPFQMLELIDRVRTEVLDRFGISLEMEITQWP